MECRRALIFPSPTQGGLAFGSVYATGCGWAYDEFALFVDLWLKKWSPMLYSWNSGTLGILLADFRRNDSIIRALKSLVWYTLLVVGMSICAQVILGQWFPPTSFFFSDFISHLLIVIFFSFESGAVYWAIYLKLFIVCLFIFPSLSMNEIIWLTICLSSEIPHEHARLLIIYTLFCTILSFADRKL